VTTLTNPSAPSHPHGHSPTSRCCPRPQSTSR
jgi:hypothetical protein